jgi:hypothetical protein
MGVDLPLDVLGSPISVDAFAASRRTQAEHVEMLLALPEVATKIAELSAQVAATGGALMVKHYGTFTTNTGRQTRGEFHLSTYHPGVAGSPNFGVLLVKKYFDNATPEVNFTPSP